jgi:small subunit ribosomal protein S1
MSEENKNLIPDEQNENEIQASQAETQPETPVAEEKPVEPDATPEPEAEAIAETEETTEAPNEPEPLVEETHVAEETPIEEAPLFEDTAEKDEPANKPAEVLPLADFDWDAIGKKQDAYSASERERLEAIYDETLKSIGEGEVIDGTVVSMNNREVVVNIGFKSDGVIAVSEVRYNPDIKPGSPIEVYVESQEDITGQLILSHKKARTLRSWERINQALENDEIITGYTKCRTKGGLIVDVFGIEAFLPGSQIDVKPIRDYDIFVGKTMEFKVVKINQEYKNVVVSHKALIEAELELQKVEIISKLEKGQILEGTIKNITSYGVFVDLGGVDGLIHITDLSWSRINHPEEIVTLDEKINVVILDFDENKKRIALGLKQLSAHPWETLDENLKVGDKVKGKVVVIADYGAFIEIAPGIEGLIHVSEMSWSQHLRTAQDFLKVGDEVDAVILILDREERKMSLGIKQLIPDPWENIIEKYKVDSKHSATVRNFTNFGIFVELEEGVDGLIHISDLSWSKKIKHPAEFTKIGEKIEVMVLGVDKENRRLSLGHKQLEENPWEVFETVFKTDTLHQGTIVGTSDKGVIVLMPYGVEAFAPTRHIVKEDGQPAKIDETLDFKVLEFNKDSKKIVVSHSRVYQDEKFSEKQAEKAERQKVEKKTKSAVSKIKDNIEKTTLGDLSVLADLKSEIEKSEQADLKEKLAVLDAKEAAKQTKATKTEKAKKEDKPKDDPKPAEETKTIKEPKAVKEEEPAKSEEVKEEKPAKTKKVEKEPEAIKEIADEKPAETKASKPSNLLTEARDGKPDDLKKISGVGPKLEELLHKNGVFHFDQIAAWTPEEISYMDDQLSFKGRIERDNWIEQATTFAAE